MADSLFDADNRMWLQAGAGFVFLSRTELEELVDTGAGPDEILAWINRQIDAPDPDKENQ